MKNNKMKSKHISKEAKKKNKFKKKRNYIYNLLG